jgi:hypothetical protein
MATQVKPTTKNSSPMRVGTGKNNLPAKDYAKPHTMSGKEVAVEENPGYGKDRSKLDSMDVSIGRISKSAGNEGTKTSGIVTRGNGAATKGITARGPMA